MKRIDKINSIILASEQIGERIIHPVTKCLIRLISM